MESRLFGFLAFSVGYLLLSLLDHIHERWMLWRARRELLRAMVLVARTKH
jgi:hypothetical protein